ncbi:riboflavin synthase [Helicobacter didelphidarum]|uniref:Riboflavin synthase n=1 Tax=Helicobacter didelphidarum TaxID=2040648 RepID=A0A3D8IMP4_9HELI|nr:riboflavin synthase [Helicobacter didelphidarum]RDU66528.1 riboflavin synthase [Helicobacter didelphidarum]
MFSGLVREFAHVRFYHNQILCLESALNPNIGDSIAINGVCLTAIESKKDFFCVELSNNTAQTIAIENLTHLVHIEPALKLQDGLHGHIVQGHIDSLGIIQEIQQKKNQHIFQIQTNERTLRLMIEKGSVCIDGISLTINRVEKKYFELIVIPHTMNSTLFSTYKTGRRVNIETDVIVRSIESILYKYMQTHSTYPHNDFQLHRQIDNDKMMQEVYDSITLGYS